MTSEQLPVAVVAVVDIPRLGTEAFLRRRVAELEASQPFLQLSVIASKSFNNAHRSLSLLLSPQLSPLVRRPQDSELVSADNDLKVSLLPLRR